MSDKEDNLDSSFFVVYRVDGEFDDHAVAQDRVHVLDFHPDFHSANDSAEKLEADDGELYWTCEIESSQVPGFDFRGAEFTAIEAEVASTILDLVQNDITNRSGFDSFSIAYNRFNLGLNLSLVTAVVLIIVAVVFAIAGKYLVGGVVVTLGLVTPILYIFVARSIMPAIE